MNIKGHKITIKQVICLALYYSVAIYLPDNNSFLKFGGKVRRFLCKRIFKKAGEGMSIHRGAFFGIGVDVEIGHHSDIGVNARVPSDITIGNYVLMAPNCFVLGRNHEYCDTTVPISLQGYGPKKKTIIEDDVWIGRDVMMTQGRHISKGTIIAARCMLTKDFPEYSIVGGNPSRIIRMRK